MSTVSASEARTHFSALLERAVKDERITITRHGIPVARLVPFQPSTRRDREQVIRELEEFGRGRTLKGVSVRELIDSLGPAQEVGQGADCGSGSRPTFE